MLRSLIKAAFLRGSIALAATPAAPVLADSGPSQVLYIFPGVRDTGDNTTTGIATVVLCFSFSPIQETLQFTVRDFGGRVAATATLGMTQFQTATIVTHQVNIYVSDQVLATGSVGQGVLGITATSANIVCTAQVVDAGAAVPNGIDLHGTRFNPISGSQE